MLNNHLLRSIYNIFYKYIFFIDSILLISVFKLFSISNVIFIIWFENWILGILYKTYSFEFFDNNNYFFQNTSNVTLALNIGFIYLFFF